MTWILLLVFMYAGDLEVPGGDMTLTSVTPGDLTFLFTGDWTTFDLGDPFTGDDFTCATGVLVTFETGEFLWGGDFIMLSFFEPFLPCCAGWMLSFSLGDYHSLHHID